MQTQDLALTGWQPFKCRLQIPLRGFTSNLLLWLRQRTQIGQPSRIMWVAMAGAHCPLPGHVLSHFEKVRLWMLNELGIVVPQQPQEYFLGDIIDVTRGDGPARTQNFPQR